jgi:hypothetical protein
LLFGCRWFVLDVGGLSGDRRFAVVGDLLRLLIAAGGVVWLVSFVLQYLRKNFYKFSRGCHLGYVGWHPFALL